MFNTDTWLDAAVAEDYVQKLGQFAGGDLYGVADDGPEALVVPPLEAFDPAEHMIPDHALRHFIRRKFDGLFDADVFRFGARFPLAAVQTVGDGKTIAGKKNGGCAGFLNDHLKS